MLMQRDISVAKTGKYYKNLSEESKVSFKLQGGWMSGVEKEIFENKEFFNESITLRKADDAAKEYNVDVDVDFYNLLKTLMN